MFSLGVRDCKLESDTAFVGSAPNVFEQCHEHAAAQGRGHAMSEEVLQRVCRIAVGVTGADGAVIALQAGVGWVCRARTGNRAPGLGALLDMASGISGKCVQTGQTLICQDAFTDGRVAADVCDSLGIRSVLAVPIKRDEEVFGLLEVLSDQPNAFREYHVSRLRRLLDSLSELLYKITEADLEVKRFQYPLSVSKYQGDPQSQSLLRFLEQGTYQAVQRARAVKVVAMAFVVLGTIGSVMWFICSQ